MFLGQAASTFIMAQPLASSSSIRLKTFSCFRTGSVSAPKSSAMCWAKPYKEAVLGRHLFWVGSCRTEGQVNLNYVLSGVLFDEVQLANGHLHYVVLGFSQSIASLLQSNLHLRYPIFKVFFWLKPWLKLLW